MVPRNHSGLTRKNCLATRLNCKLFDLAKHFSATDSFYKENSEHKVLTWPQQGEWFLTFLKTTRLGTDVMILKHRSQNPNMFLMQCCVAIGLTLCKPTWYSGKPSWLSSQILPNDFAWVWLPKEHHSKMARKPLILRKRGAGGGGETCLLCCYARLA